MTRRDPAQAGPESAGDAAHGSTGPVKVWHPKPMPIGTVYSPKDASCRTCSQPLSFKLTRSGVWQPWDAAKDDVHFHRKPRATRCSHCGSELFETVYRGGETFIPEPHFGRATCTECGRSWWVGK